MPTTEMAGAWVLSALGEAEVSWMLRIAGEQVVSEWPSRGVSPSIELLEAAGGTLIRMSDGGETRDLLWRDIGPDRALLLMAGADIMLLARRRGPVPRAIQGEWVVTAPDGDPVRRMEFASNSVQMLTVSGEQREGEAAGLGVEGPGRFALMLAVDSPMGRRPGVLLLQEVEPDVYSMFPVGEERDYEVLHRPGARPAWLGSEVR